MSLVIVSRNYFAKIAFNEIYDEAVGDLCVVDATSFHNLHDLKNELQIRDLSKGFRIVIFGDKGLFSRILHPLKVVHLNSSICDIKLAMSSGYRLDEILKRISSCCSLTCLSSQERSLARALCMETSIKDAAFRLNLDDKFLYNRTAIVASKLNLRSGKEFFFFLHKEFNFH